MPTSTPEITREDQIAYALLGDPDAHAGYYDTPQAYRGALVWASLHTGALPSERTRLDALEIGTRQALQGLSPSAPMLPALESLSRRISQAQARYAQVDAQIAAWLAQTPQETSGADAQADDQTEAQTPQERAIRLLRAALLLVMDQDQDRPEGGQKARLSPPRPNLPPGGPGGNAVAVPTKPDAGDFQF